MMITAKLLILSVLPSLALPMTNQDLELTLAFVSNKGWLNLNFACNVTRDQIRIIFNQLGDKTIGFHETPAKEQNVVLCISEYEQQDGLIHILDKGVRRHDWILVGSREQIDFVNKFTKLGINQRVFFLDTDSTSLEESYKIESYFVTRAVAQIVHKNGHKKIKWLQNEHFESRRANFHHLNLRGIVGINPPHAMVVPQFYPMATWHKDKNGALVASVPKEYLHGIYADMLIVLEKDLNFTTSITWRRDNQGGIPIMKNGTFVKWGGMVGDTVSGDYDMIVHAIPTTLERADVVDHLQAMGSVTLAVFVSSSAGNEQRALLTYLIPFRPELWLLLVMNCLLIVVFLKFIHWLLVDLPISTAFSSINFVKDYWIVFFSYFGGSGACSGLWWSFSITKRTLIVICLSGCLTNMAYRSSLTSALSVRNHVLPFTTPKGFYDSNFRLLYTWTDLVASMKLLKRKSDFDWFTKSLQEQGNSESAYIPSIEDAIAQVVIPYSEKALLNSLEVMTMFPQYKCDIIPAWSKLNPVTGSISLPKGSPYFSILDFALLKRKETGTYKRVKNIHHKTILNAPCRKQLKGTPLGVFKLIGAYVAFAFGILISLVLLAVEILSSLVNLQERDWSSIQDYILYDKGIYDLTEKWGPKSQVQRKSFEKELISLLENLEANKY